MRFRLFVVAVVLVFGALSVRTVGHGQPVALKRPFWQFAMELAPWTGTDIRLTQAIEKKVGVSAYLFRTYTRPDRKNMPVNLYVGYYESQKHGEMIHSPKNCLPGNGWFIESRDDITLDIPPYQPFTVNKFVIANGIERQVVLYWYQQAGGRVITNEYLGRAHLVIDALTKKRTDAALIRVIVPTRDDQVESREASTATAVEFVKAAYPELMRFLPHERPTR